MPTLDQTRRNQAPQGITHMPAIGGWRVIIAKAGQRACSWYYHQNDDKRHVAGLERQATDWIAQ